jgi:hypothetical protein
MRLRQAGGAAEGMKKLREITGIGPLEAKVFFVHLIKKPGLCNNCRRPVEGYGTIIECKHCESIAFNL